MQRISELFKNTDLYEILDRFKGKTLEGKTYHPLFPYFQHLKKKLGAFRILTASFVTVDQGTGVVHQAPYFGEVGYFNIHFFHCIFSSLICGFRFR